MSKCPLRGSHMPHDFCQGLPIQVLIEDSSLGALREKAGKIALMGLTGMKEEQADWEADE